MAMLLEGEDKYLIRALRRQQGMRTPLPFLVEALRAVPIRQRGRERAGSLVRQQA